MRIWTTLAVAAVAVLAVGSSHAAGTSNAKNRVLQRSDVPAGAKRIAFGQSSGSIKIPRAVHGTVAYAAYRFNNGSKKEIVGSAVGTLKNTRDAHDVLVKLSKDAKKGGVLKPLKLPKYGQEQTALAAAVSQASSGVLVVRSNKTLWEVTVSAIPGLSKGKLVSELKKYAAKEKRRAT